jgi:tetratricopeptide (TPR) repeat protein
MAGFFGWKILSGLNDYRHKYVRALSIRYEESGDVSDLLELTLLSPTSRNISETNDILLITGDYKTAELLNMLVKDENFSLKVAESALFNFDFEIAEVYLTAAPDSKAKNELIIFQQHQQNNSNNTVEDEPITDAGKIMKMIQEKDFYIYDIRYPIGSVISENNIQHSEHIENVLMNADSLADFGYYHLALQTLSENLASCNKDYFIIKSDIYRDMNNYADAIAVTEQALVCNSTDLELLSLAIEDYLKVGDPSKSEFYQRRFNYLNNISR